MSLDEWPVPELQELEHLREMGGKNLQSRTTSLSLPDGRSLPIHCLMLGTALAHAPAIGFFGGVHGLERIGAQVVIAFLRNLLARLRWDESLHALLQRVRVVFMPVVNPGGMVLGTRANPHGVDLMRNSPVEAVQGVPFLAGGQRVSRALPWYRGPEGAPMETESALLCECVERELLGRPFSMALDCHSGFGIRDRLWFPWAHRRGAFPHLAQLHAWHGTFEASHPHHTYVVEPQSRQYLAHGDLWDHLYVRACDKPGTVFLPLTLEMGSWLWVKKNPRQLFSRTGIFNPEVAHREERVLRRHLPLLDFALRAAASSANWLPAAHEEEAHRVAALARWWPR